MPSQFRIRLCIELVVEAETDNPQFLFEEHRCADDFIEQAMREVAEADANGTCTCNRATVTYLGPVEDDYAS